MHGWMDVGVDESTGGGASQHATRISFSFCTGVVSVFVFPRKRNTQQHKLLAFPHTRSMLPLGLCQHLMVSDRLAATVQAKRAAQCSLCQPPTKFTAQYCSSGWTAHNGFNHFVLLLLAQLRRLRVAEGKACMAQELAQQRHEATTP